MHISWLGQTCVKLQIKNKHDEDILVLIDAYRPLSGDFPRSFSPHIALYSQGREGAATLSQNPFIIDTLGEFEIKDVIIYALPGPDSIIYRVNAEGINLVHLGRLNKKMEDDKFKKINNVDILFISVGGEKTYLQPEAAVELIAEIEPRLVIPMGYRCDTDPKTRPLNDFLKEIGLKPDIIDKKIIIKKKDLPQEETKIIVLEKNH